jgi:hypothetical protein
MTTTALFPELPSEASVWVFVANRRITQQDGERLLSTTRAFTSSWVSHGRRVNGDSVILEDRMLLVGGFVQGGDLSGCGIDASFRAVTEVGQHLGIEWLPALTVVYRDKEGQVATASRAEFRELAASGEITPQSHVFDTSLSRLQDVRDRFEIMASDSWHARLLSDVVPS